MTSQYPSESGALRHAQPVWSAVREAAVVTDASGLGLLGFEGPDAAAFLQGQLSNDAQALPEGAGQWTSYNSPKGRMLATLYLWRERAAPSDRYFALLAADLAASVAKRLAMFVLRSKLTVAEVTVAHRCLGVGGPAAADAVRAALGTAPPPGRVATRDGATIVHWPDGRLIVVTAATSGDATLAALASHAVIVGPGIWDWLTVRAGIPMITAATQDQFVAQSANWDAIGGLDFTKGCYPGQEIIARTRYLGRLKERLFVFGSDSEPPLPGTRLYSVAFGDQACGTVINSAPDGAGRARFLAIVQIEAAEGGPLAIGAPDGPSAERETLPYDVPAPVAPRGRIGS